MKNFGIGAATPEIFYTGMLRSLALHNTYA